MAPSIPLCESGFRLKGEKVSGATYSQKEEIQEFKNFVSMKINLDKP